MNETIIVFIVFASLTAIVLVIGLVCYFAKRLEHKQIMAAIEKGIPISELRPTKPKPAGPLWIKHLTVGIVLLAIALGLALGGGVILVAFVLGGIGIASIVRALLYRKYQPQIQPSDKNKTTENKDSPAVSKSEIVEQTDEQPGLKA